ncbi:MAG: XdhC family protein [Chthonomonadaceae bacterium]|nr:XdhC family protein [Chthonomonadaceae bacterium]
MTLGLLNLAERWSSEGHRVALVTVTKTSRSAPRRPGSMMLVRDDMLSYSSVSGGCVEATLIDQALLVLQSGIPTLATYGNEEPVLSCGGSIEVWIEPCPAQTELAKAKIEMDSNREVSWTVGPSNASVTFTYGPKRRLFLIGAVPIAASLARQALELGFAPTIIDPREVFLRSSLAAYPELAPVRGWPNEVLNSHKFCEQDALVALSHDDKIDDMAVETGLKAGAWYVGALGSGSTQAARKERLSEAGLSAEILAKIKGPVGLKIGAVTPEEIALSIVAEIVQYSRET